MGFEGDGFTERQEEACLHRLMKQQLDKLNDELDGFWGEQRHLNHKIECELRKTDRSEKLIARYKEVESRLRERETETLKQRRYLQAQLAGVIVPEQVFARPVVKVGISSPMLPGNLSVAGTAESLSSPDYEFVSDEEALPKSSA